jgi:hypothetical protein
MVTCLWTNVHLNTLIKPITADLHDFNGHSKKGSVYAAGNIVPLLRPLKLDQSNLTHNMASHAPSAHDPDSPAE